MNYIVKKLLDNFLLNKFDNSLDDLNGNISKISGAILGGLIGCLVGFLMIYLLSFSQKILLLENKNYGRNSINNSFLFNTKNLSYLIYD